MTRTTDETLSPSERVNRILNAYGNNSDVIVVSNHINAGGGDGAEVIYALRNNDTLAKLVLNEIEKEGQNARKVFQRRLPSNTSRDYYFIHRETGNTQPIIVEYGFLDSTKDDVQQLKQDYTKYAEAVVRAIMEYIGKPINNANTYTVQSGDSLWNIAKKYNITVDELKQANNLTSNSLQVGQILKIPNQTQPPLNGNYLVYTVKSGDSLYKIAQQYNTTVDQLIQLNNLTTTALTIGQQIFIPQQGTGTGEVPPTNTGETIYTVQAGDSLYKIAQRYNTTVSAIASYNNLTSNELQIGQRLRIPSQGTNQPTMEQTYTVKSGDSLYKIAQQYNTTADAIKSYNNLTSNMLRVGQVLRIPTSSTSTNTYVVQAGDSLYKIAQRYNTTVDAIKRKNNITSNDLQIGQVLMI